MNDENTTNDSTLAATYRLTQTVLLVDDDSKLLRGMQRAIQDEDYELLTAVSAAEAMCVLAHHDVDLIISDNLMPGVLGTEFLAQVKEKYPDITLMMLSGYIAASAAKHAVEEIGVVQVLTKPCRASEVVQAIRDAIG